MEKSSGDLRKKVLQALTGTLTPTQPSLLYKAGLGVVAFTMILLPAVYIGLIGFAAWGVYYHATRHAHWMGGGGSPLGKALIYCSPIVIGTLLVVFMVKPFFARRQKTSERFSITAKEEPLLFAFIEKICRAVNAPLPTRVDVDCQVNASASFRRGVWSLFGNDVVLTIGLPLTAGLTMREFAGVLAHEFGHFAQGAGMKFTYIIRHINFWFSRVVYERDAWDIRLEQLARNIDLRIGLVLHAGRGCIWLTRKILWALMHAGHAISCFMLRQMEYDADSYECKLAGSDAFESTAMRLQTLSVGNQIAQQELYESWQTKRLPDNLPAFINHRTGLIPPDVTKKLKEDFANHKTGVFDTHPADSDRVAAARALNEKGIFHVEEPASNLFSNFAELSKRLTKFFYEKEAQLEITDQNLVATESAVSESKVKAEADEALYQYFGGITTIYNPLIIRKSDIIGLPDTALSRTNLREGRTRFDADKARLETILTNIKTAEAKLLNAMSALALMRARFSIKAKDFDLPAADQLSAESAVESHKQDMAKQTTQLGEGLCIMRQRLIAALQLLRDPEVFTVIDTSGQLRAEVDKLTAVLGHLDPTFQPLHEMRRNFPPLQLLLQNRANHSEPEKVDIAVSQITAVLQNSLTEIRKAIKDVPYPFPHARGAISVAEYLKNETLYKTELEFAYYDSDACLERLFTLYHRILGRLVLIARTVEAQVDREEKMVVGSGFEPEKA